MRDSVARLFASILNFIVNAMKWYKEGKLLHTLTAITKPWQLSFSESVEEIGFQSRLLEKLASSASKAELRDTHREIYETRKELQEAHGKINQLVQISYELDLKCTSRSFINNPFRQSVYPDDSSIRHVLFEGKHKSDRAQPDLIPSFNVTYPGLW